jgi:hypothetical protein
MAASMAPPARPKASLLVWRTADGTGDTPGAILALVLDRLRAENRVDGAREISLAITHCEEALHWIWAIEKRRRST